MSRWIVDASLALSWCLKDEDDRAYNLEVLAGLNENEALVVFLWTYEIANGIVMAVENSTLPSSVIPDPQAVGDSLYTYLEQRGFAIVRALQHFRAVNASDEIAQQMDIAPHDALLLITRIGYTADQRAIELTDTYCRNDYYDFVAELRK